jgi:hypothetical protein
MVKTGMHTATQLQSSMFAIEIDGTPASREQLLPHWHPHDRLGIVAGEPFGALGASLLMQLVITAFFDAKPERRNYAAQYPEIYLFHAGEPTGDHSYFDFWPQRKEVVVEPDPGAILTAINERAITRLVVVDSEPVPAGHRDAELDPARDRIVSAFAYAPTGQVSDQDVTVAGLDPATEVNAAMSLDPEFALGAPVDVPDEVARSQERVMWLERFESRVPEIARNTRRQLAARRQASLENGCVRESYRRIPVEAALDMLTASVHGARGSDPAAAARA